MPQHALQSSLISAQCFSVHLIGQLPHAQPRCELAEVLVRRSFVSTTFADDFEAHDTWSRTNHQRQATLEGARGRVTYKRSKTNAE
mmetsp:Transcript_35429/g.63746  ORF Transcript_35429/g.63746 Transcript_35429/m.63746 type:complete len:86 (+) Transcript_35429:547-804(+)